MRTNLFANAERESREKMLMESLIKSALPYGLRVVNLRFGTIKIQMVDPDHVLPLYEEIINHYEIMNFTTQEEVSDFLHKRVALIKFKMENLKAKRLPVFDIPVADIDRAINEKVKKVPLCPVHKLPMVSMQMITGVDNGEDYFSCTVIIYEDPYTGKQCNWEARAKKKEKDG